MRWRGQDGFDTQSLNAFSVLRDTRQPIPVMRVNKMGYVPEVHPAVYTYFYQLRNVTL